MGDTLTTPYIGAKMDSELEIANTKIKKLEEELQYSVDNNMILQRAYNNLDEELQEIKRVIKRCFND